MASIIHLPDGRRMSYHLSGSPNSPVVMLSNSLCAPYETWARVVPVLSAKGYRILGYDQPGHGASSVPHDLHTTTFDSLAEDAKHLIDYLGIPKLFAWIGVSMGAATGIVFATKFPRTIQNLIACDTISCSPINAGTEDVFASRVNTARREGSLDSIIQQTLARWFAKSWRDENPAEVERLLAVMRTTSVDGFAACVNVLTSPSFDLRPLAPALGDVVERALFVVGENDANLLQTMAELKGRVDATRPGVVSFVVIPRTCLLCRRVRGVP
ncbi:alpha/beta-hydrolase [Trematosphaeria pertusa]|uniref:Alpha/beta-hydrolase n=1 Tax=Trematosphaeria pertusa TaxID=390896 RepID=A0A6A6J3M6_9PLEO|nr:alpha/beta-hydrolase [Trematosphaeria pertusa]KAF2256083.1 alpha/beta-hydrolase [Trematosphaeria pertusa]